MDAAHEFLRNLALVFCVAGVTTLIFQRLRQPVIFGYLFAGFIIGPNTPIPLVADEGIVRTFAELGVILLMFSLGLEFSLRKLIKVGPAAGAIAVGETSAMMCVGYLLGRALGWSTMESVYTGAIIAIASTTIILKAFSEQGLRERFTRLVFGVLIVEDLIAIFVLAILTTISSGEVLTPLSVLGTARTLVLFLAGLIGIGLLVVPRLIRLIMKLESPETTLVATIGLCFGCALLALTFSYSVALGAFIGGSLVAESGHGRAIEHLVRPVRDIFGAMFFVAVGMLIDPALIMDHIGAVAVLTVAVIVGKVTFVTFMSVLTGQDVRTSVRTGMSMAQIGEFSFIIASLGLALGATGQFLYPVAVAVSAITALTTPWLIIASDPAAAFIDRKLPRRLQMFVGLYGTWFERMQHSEPTPGTYRRTIRKPAFLLLLDAALLLGLIITTALELPRLTALVAGSTGMDPRVAARAVLGIAVFACAFLCVGIWRVNLRVSSELAWRAFAPPGKGVDYAAAPRRALQVTLQIVILVLIGLPLVALTQPFLPLFRGSVLLVALLGLLAIAFWRSVSNLHGHARAGAEIILMALSRQMKDEEAEQDREPELERIRQALPGLGEPVAIRIVPEAPCVRRTLAELNLRGRTGATVLAISRNGEDVLLPNGHEALLAGDTLFVGGTQRAVAAARSLLVKGTA
jgi:CPA2 family monovalent cation:H+ antiporter-2